MRENEEASASPSLGVGRSVGLLVAYLLVLFLRMHAASFAMRLVFF